MQKSESRRSQGAACAARILALLLIICLAECATEQRINRIGNKAGLLEKVNGWRSQRGGSCLSYGHSCWGGTARHVSDSFGALHQGLLPIESRGNGVLLSPHGKRSAKPPTAAPDWYLTRLLRRMAVNAEMNRARQDAANDDINAIFQMDVPDDSQPNRLMNGNDAATDLGPMKPEAIPMLDDELLSKMKLWKIMRDAADEK